MKKIIIIFIALFFGLQFVSSAQSLDEMRNQIHNKMKGETFLKEFDSHLTPNSEMKNSLVLSKNTRYMLYTYISEPSEVEITLFDKFKNILFQSKSDQKGVINFSLKCNKTGVYYLFVKNLTNKELENVFIVTFAGVFEPKDIEEITPKVTQTETIVNNNEGITKEENTDVYFAVEQMPKFNGKSQEAFNDFIKQKLTYPQTALQNKIEGKVLVQFTVGKDGYIKDAKIIRSVHPALDQEALRIVYSSPKWEPGIQSGKTANVVLTFPVVFELSEKWTIINPKEK